MAWNEYTNGVATCLSTDTKLAKTDGWAVRETDTGDLYVRQGGAWILSPTSPDRRTVNYRLITAATASLGISDNIVGVNRAGPVTLDLPSANIAAGHRYIIKDESGLAGTNNITITTEGAELIDGAATQLINTNYGSLGVYSNGTNWFTL